MFKVCFKWKWSKNTNTCNQKKKSNYKDQCLIFSAHLHQRSLWGIVSAVVGGHHRLQPQTFNIQSISHKPLAQLEENLVEMLLGWWPAFSMIFVSFGKSTWLLWPILLSHWLKFTKSSFCVDQKCKMATYTGNSFSIWPYWKRKK